MYRPKNRITTSDQQRAYMWKNNMLHQRVQHSKTSIAREQVTIFLSQTLSQGDSLGEFETGPTSMSHQVFRTLPWCHHHLDSRSRNHYCNAIVWLRGSTHLLFWPSLMLSLLVFVLETYVIILLISLLFNDLICNFLSIFSTIVILLSESIILWNNQNSNTCHCN